MRIPARSGLSAAIFAITYFQTNNGPRINADHRGFQLPINVDAYGQVFSYPRLSALICGSLPVRMNRTKFRLVFPSIGMGAEEVALRLRQVLGQVRRAIAVE